MNDVDGIEDLKCEVKYRTQYGQETMESSGRNGLSRSSGSRDWGDRGLSLKLTLVSLNRTKSMASLFARAY